MENIILQKTRYLKALMLTMLVGLFAFDASAQTWDATTFPLAPQYVNQEATVTYEASGFPAGTTFILWDDAFFNGEIDPDETIFGTATAQGAATDIDFVWPDNNVNLRLGGFSGSVVEGEIIDIGNQDVTVVGTNSTGYSYVFNRASVRSLTTTAYDLDTTDPVVLSMNVSNFGLDVDNPLEVRYSTNGFATAGTVLVEDGSGLDEFDFGGTLNFTLPSGAKNPNVSFRIQQTGTIDYGQGKRWDVNFAEIEIGETYLLENPPGLGVDEFITVLTPQLDITDILNTDNVSFGNIYPGDDVTVQAELLEADLTGIDFAVTVTSFDGQRYLLENQNVTVDNVTKQIEVVGDVPANIMYDNSNAWELEIHAYEGAEILFGISEFYDFTGGLPSDFEQIGGFQDGDGLTFDQAGERSVTTVPYNIASTSGSLIFTAARLDNVLSPAGTDLIVEYSTDGETYTELASISLNSLSTAGTTDTLDAWPAGVVSNSTQFRFRQEGNNGADLDAFIIEDLEIQSNTNIVSEDLIGRGSAFDDVFIFSPFITLDNINVGGDGQAFPMEEYALTYTIDAGTFPANTPATAYLQRTGQPDIIIGETTNANGESITFTVPPIEAGDYNIYFRTLNDQQYGTVNLAVYDIGLEITSVDYADPVIVAGDEFTYPGSAITANYTIQGTAGAGAELMMSVFDNNPDVNDWVMIGSTTTLDGAITATLPTGIDYDPAPNVRVSLGSGGVYSSAFSETVLDEQFYNSSIPAEILESSQGIGDTYITDGFEGSGVRSATSVPLDFTYGGNLDLDLWTEANFISSFDVRLEGSTDGTTWEELEVITFTGFFNTETFNTAIPNELWSEEFQFRIIYNEDEAFGFGDNVVVWWQADITRPTFLEVIQDDAPFNLIRPSLAVSDYDKTAFAMGEEVSINYNAIGFPAATDYAAVIEQGGEYFVAGTASAEDAGTISATMPIGFENPANTYSLSIVPFEPATAGGDYKQGETINIDNEDDFLIVSGQDPANASNFNLFDFDRIGNRELLTKAYDLSGTSSATLNFNFNTWFGYGSSDVNANKNTVPRLEISTDGGATFQVIPVYELEEGEEQIYDDGLLYLQQGYNVELPASALTAATHFRFSQPLNLGEQENRWSLDNISLTLNDDNAVPDFIFTDDVNGNNPVTINITSPSLNGYDWMQSNLQDAVFNGETFDYSWNLAEGFNASDVDAFPAGTNFTFFLEEGGDYVMDPNTNMPYVLGTTTALGTFEGTVPFFVENGSYNVRLSASIEIEGEDGPEDFYFYGNEETGDDVGDLDVFLRVAELVYQGDPNATIYAGQDVTFGVDFENNETNAADVEELYVNLILNTNQGNLVLATQQGTADITVALPTDVTGFRNFSLEVTENAPIAEVGSILENSDYSNLELGDNFITGVEPLQVTTDLFFESQVINNAAIFADGSFDQKGSQTLIFEYSINGGAYVQQTSRGNGNWSFGFILPNQMTNNSGNDNIRYRFRLSGNTPDGSTFSINNLRIDREYPFGNNVFPNLTETGGVVEFPNVSGRRLITTRDFAAEEIADATLLTFEASFDQLPANLTASQYVVFEYSTDGGTTYTEVESYPEMDAMMTLSNEPFTYAVNADMKENGVRFRWRQEEAKGNFSVDNINMVFGEVLPFDYISTSQSISSQALIIDAVSATEGCLEDNVTIDYTIRGRFGADNILTVDYSDANDLMNATPIDGYEFNVTEGSGQVSFAFAGNALGLTADNANYKFRLSANDETTDNTVNVDGAFSETSYELVAPVNTDATFTVLNDPLSCSPEDVMVSINAGSMQDYFLYEILNAADGSVLGSLVRDPEEPENEINLGAITAATDLELRITSQSSTGTICNTVTVDEESVEVLANFELYSELNINQAAKLVVAGDEFTTCDGADDIQLSVRRLLADGSTTTGGATLVEWFRDDLNNLVASGTSFIDDDGDIEMSGAYFARITTGNCVYNTESIQINLVETPDQPTVTVVSGDLEACSSADPVVLAAPEGFAYYSWNTGAATRTISVENQGSYNVRVSNVPFGTGCASPNSVAVDVTRYDSPEFAVSLNTGTSGLIGVGEVLDVCDASERIFFLEDGSYDNDGIVQVIKDGVNYTTVESPTRFIDLDESGVYSFVWNFNSLNVEGCTSSSVEFTLNLNEAADVTPTITATGDLNSCDPENEVTLEGPEGFASYVWERNGQELVSNSRTITVSQSGSYTVQVSNQDSNVSCGLSNASSPVVVNVAPDADDYDVRVNGSIIVENAEVEVCSDNETSLAVGFLGNGTVKWFRDGAEIAPNFASNNNVLVTESGIYNAEVTVGQCVVTTYAVTVTVVETPDAPVLASTGALSFCEGEGTVTLTAPAGFEYYTWRRGNSVVNSGSNGLANSNVIEVSTTGSYTVTVSNSATACASVRSNPIVVNEVAEPNLPFLNQVNNTCGDGAVEFRITNNNNGGAAMTYQLYNGETGQVSGNPVTIEGGQIGSIFTEVLTEDGIPFYVEVMYADGTGCSYVDPSATVDADVRTITLEIEGATLTANYDGNADVRWYRNEVLLTNATSRSITIADAAEYTIEVEYASGCVLTASSADIDGRVLSSRDAMDMQITSYPNPTQSDVTLNVSSQYMGKHEVIISSMTGQVMLQSSFEKSSFEAKHAMDVANLQEGIYNVQIRHDGLSQNVRIIKK